MVGCLHADSDVDSFYLADVNHTAAGWSDHDGRNHSYQYVYSHADIIYHHGICLRYTRHCGGRFLYAGAKIGRTGRVCRHPKHFLPPCIHFRTRSTRSYRRGHRTEIRQHSVIMDDHDAGYSRHVQCGKSLPSLCDTQTRFRQVCPGTGNSRCKSHFQGVRAYIRYLFH